MNRGRNGRRRRPRRRKRRRRRRRSRITYDRKSGRRSGHPHFFSRSGHRLRSRSSIGGSRCRNLSRRCRSRGRSFGEPESGIHLHTRRGARTARQGQTTHAFREPVGGNSRLLSRLLKEGGPAYIKLPAWGRSPSGDIGNIKLLTVIGTVGHRWARGRPARGNRRHGRRRPLGGPTPQRRETLLQV